MMEKPHLMMVKEIDQVTVMENVTENDKSKSTDCTVLYPMHLLSIE